MHYSSFGLAIALVLAGTPALAKNPSFSAVLRGDNETTHTGSKATGSARIMVDLDKQRINLKLTVNGLTVDKLWDQLVTAPIGPIHLHVYASHNHSDPNASSLILPLPYGPSYRATKTGFTVIMNDYSYEQGAKTLGSKASLTEFVEAMKNGSVVVNIHTDAFNEGEISGKVIPDKG